MSNRKNLNELIKKKKAYVFVPKTQNSLVMYDLLIEIDDFFNKLKKSDVDDEYKAKVIKNFNNLLLQISLNFEKISQKTDIPFETPLSLQLLTEK